MNKTIYVYETEYSRNLTKIIDGQEYKGFIKIGETTGDVNSRINAQFMGVPHEPNEQPWTLLYTSDNVTLNGKHFSDKKVHQQLEFMGFKRIDGTEWFSCKLTDVITAIESIKNNNDTGNIYERKIKELLSKKLHPLTVRQIAQQLDKKTTYIQCIVQALYKNNELKRIRTYDEALHKVTYAYQMNSYNQNNIRKISTKNKYINLLEYSNLTPWEFLNLMNNKNIKDGITHISELLGYNYSTIEKVWYYVKKLPELNPLITYEKDPHTRSGKIVKISTS